jgi:hypothetical protein
MIVLVFGMINLQGQSKYPRLGELKDLLAHLMSLTTPNLIL